MQVQFDSVNRYELSFLDRIDSAVIIQYTNNIIPVPIKK